MRVLHIIESLDFGGAEKIVVGLANGMADMHDIAVCCLKRVGVLSAELDQRIQVFCLDKGEGNDYVLPLRLARLIRQNRFDIVHTHNWAVFLEGGIAAFLASTPLLLHTVHGPYAAYPVSWRSRLRQTARHLLERLISRRCYRIVTVSDAIRDYVTKTIGIAPNRLLTIHNGIPAASAPSVPRSTRATVTFMTVGRLAAIKNQEMMLQAFDEVSKKRPHVHLAIVGDGPERAALEAYVQRQHLNDNVSFLGFRSDIDALLHRADVFMLTSRYEGISVALLEAMRAGLPAICTAVGGVPETVLDGQTGLLVAPDDVAGLVRAMTRVTDLPALRDEMGKQGYDYFIKEFSLTTMLSRYQGLYTKSI